MAQATIIPVNPVDKAMINKMTTVTAPVNRAATIVLVNKVMAPVNNRTTDLANNPTAPDNRVVTITAPANKTTVQDNKVLTMAPVNKATDLVNKAVMIIALVNKAPVATVQEL